MPGKRSDAVQAIADALMDTEGRWKDWAPLTVARLAAKAVEGAGFRLVPMPSRERQYDGPEGARFTPRLTENGYYDYEHLRAHIDGDGLAR